MCLLKGRLVGWNGKELGTWWRDTTDTGRGMETGIGLYLRHLLADLEMRGGLVSYH